MLSSNGVTHRKSSPRKSVSRHVFSEPPNIAHELPASAIPTSRSDSGWRELGRYDLAVLEHNAQVPAPLPVVCETRRVGDRIEHLTRRTIDGVS